MADISICLYIPYQWEILEETRSYLERFMVLFSWSVETRRIAILLYKTDCQNPTVALRKQSKSTARFYGLSQII